MKTLVAVLAAVFTILGVMIGIVFFSESTEIVRERTFDPLHEDNRRHTFEHSRAYIEGTAQELQSMQLEYLKSSPEHQEAIASIVLHRTASMPLEAFPSDLRDFVRQIRQQRGL